MPLKKSIVCLGLVVLLASCKLLKENSMAEMEKGMYKLSTEKGRQRAWVEFNDSVIHIFLNANKDNRQDFLFPSLPAGAGPALKISRSSFDIDALTIPFKFRPSVKDFPPQLNTNFSGAVYAGLRTDIYHFTYKQNAIGDNTRNLKHFGYSAGLFSGIGSSPVNPWVTENNVSSEYDGFILVNGIAGIIAVNKLTFGLGAGIDMLMDKNKKYWLYQKKPWIGLTVGLNLN